MRGLFVVFEGNDGAGKSSTMEAVARALPMRAGRDLPIRLTNHPGSTPLGSHLRKLVKYPESIDPSITIDSLSRQVLYMVDTISFVKQVLNPALERGEIVFADRSSFISAIVYGTAEGLKLSDVEKLFQLITPPRMDRLYILRCPWEVGKRRLDSRGNLDHFERKPVDFFQKVEKTYDELVTGPAERTLLVSRSVSPRDITYVDSTLSSERVVNKIVDDLCTLLDT